MGSMTPCVPTLLYRNQSVLCCKLLELLVLQVATLDRKRDNSSVETEKDLFDARSEDLIINVHILGRDSIQVTWS